METTRTTFNVSHFFVQNTNVLAQGIGDIALICSFLSSIPLILTQAGINNIPHIVTVLACIGTAGGVFVKMISKMVGTVDNSGQPVNTQIPSSIGVSDGNRVHPN